MNNMNTMKAPMADEASIFTEANNETHVLIGGASGCGKSTVEGGMIFNLVNNYTPDECELYLIDPKKVELHQFLPLPHVKQYADNDDDALDVLLDLSDVMDERNTWCQKHNMTMWPGAHIYCFIDEAADFISRVGKKGLKAMQLLLQMGRSARIHMIVCTQCTTANFMPTTVQCNFSCTIGLSVPKNKPHMSRTLVGSSACCKLPRHGKCVFITPDGEEIRDVPMYSPAHFDAMFRYWSRWTAKAYGRQ